MIVFLVCEPESAIRAAGYEEDGPCIHRSAFGVQNTLSSIFSGKSPRNYSFWVLSCLALVGYASQRHYWDTPLDNERHWGGRAMPIYQIRLKEQLEQHWSAWFGGLTVTTEENGETLLTGEVVDQAALHGLLSKIRDLQLTLISVCLLKAAPPSRGEARKM